MVKVNRNMKFQNTKTIIKRLVSYMTISKPLMIFVIITTIFSAVANVIGISLLKVVIDEYITPLSNSYNRELMNKFILLIFIMIFIYLIGVLSTYLSNRIMLSVSTNTLYKLRVDMFSKMEYFKISYYDNNIHGDLMSRYTNDIDALRDMLSNSIVSFLSSFITIISVFIMMIIYSFSLTIIIIVMLFLMTKLVGKIAKESSRNFKEQQKNIGEINGYIEEMISGQKVIKVFNYEDKTKEKFNKLNNNLKSSSIKAHTYANILMPIINNMSNIFYAIVAVIGGILAIYNILSLGTVVVFLQFTKTFSNPIAQISQQLNSVLAALAGLERIFEVMDENQEEDSGEVTLVNIEIKNNHIKETKKNTFKYAWKLNNEYIEVKGRIEFKNVNFSYIENKEVLKDISLYAKPGQKIAFVGSTGAGKTTITNLLNRFYDIKEGTILYDGIDIRKIKKSDLRKTISMVLQDTHLFTGTVMENIRYGNLNATDEEVIAAAKLANADEFINNLPDSYNTIITSDGINLSQGQRQLLSIARAAVANPIILVLDEATSSIDTRTELLIENGMDKLMKDRTTLVIAHRLSTVKNSNAIMVLENGIIIERGDHDDLLDQKGKYYQLYTGMFELE